MMTDVNGQVDTHLKCEHRVYHYMIDREESTRREIYKTTILRKKPL